MNNTYNIALIAPPFSGHLHPLLASVKPLLTNPNYRFVVYTGVQKIALAKQHGFHARSILKDQPTALEAIVNIDHKTGVLGSMKQLKQHVQFIPCLTEEFVTYFQRDRIDLVIADFTAISAGVAAKRCGICWATTFPTPFVLESVTSPPAYFGGWLPHDTFLYRARDVVGRAIVRRIKGFVQWWFKKEFEQAQLKLYDEGGHEAIYSPMALIAFGMKELEFRTDFPNQLQWAGMPALASSKCENVQLPLKYSNGRRILLTNGTHLLWAKERMVQIALLLAKQYPNDQFIVSQGRAGGAQKYEQLAQNVFCYSYIDYEVILPSVDRVVHHGGAGILYACVAHGKPALILPQDYDQFDYAARAKWAKIAEVSNVKSDRAIVYAFERLMKRSDWQTLFHLQETYKTYHTSATMKDVIDRLLLPKKLKK